VSFHDEICPDCGCVIGGGCPISTEEEKQAYRQRHAEDIEEASSKPSKPSEAPEAVKLSPWFPGTQSQTVH
jgi:hypothetical protein